MPTDFAAGLTHPAPLPATLASLWNLVGNTPLLALHYRYQGRPGQGTDLVRDEPVRPGYLAPDSTFTGYVPIRRLRDPLSPNNVGFFS